MTFQLTFSADVLESHHVEAIRHLLERIKKLGPYAITSASILAEIGKHIEEFKKEIRNIVLDESLAQQ